MILAKSTPMTMAVDGHVYDNECDAECNVCFETREVAGHIFEIDGHYCDVCGEATETPVHVDADEDGECDICFELMEVPHEHTYGDWEVVTEATVNADGLKVKECECGDKIEKVIPRVLQFKSKALLLSSNISMVFRVDPVYFTEHGYEN